MFVTTSFFTTPSQTRGVCSSTVACQSDANCPSGLTTPGSTPVGVLTGTCNTTAQLCEMSAWCPVEANPVQVGGLGPSQWEGIRACASHGRRGR